MSSVALFSAPLCFTSVISVLGLGSRSRSALPLQHKPRRLRQFRVLQRNRHFRQPHRRPFRCPIEMQSAMRSAAAICGSARPAPTKWRPPRSISRIHSAHDASGPRPAELTTVRSQNDLKPTISTFRSLSKSPLLSLVAQPTSDSHPHPHRATPILRANAALSPVLPTNCCAGSTRAVLRARETNPLFFWEGGTSTSIRP